nr:MAG TPA: LAGLIDADG-like domain [Caudoviricetes sp.]
MHVHKKTELTRRFTHKELVFVLSKIGNSAYNKHVPVWIKRASLQVKLAFLQGYLDTDGSVVKSKNSIRVNFTSVNLELLEDIQDLLFSIGVKNSIVLHNKECVNKFGGISKQSYRINVAQDDINKLAVCPVFESRKMKQILTYKSTGKSKMDIQFTTCNIVLGIEKINKSTYTGFVYNFECDTHTFACRNIMTHNCDPYA